LPRFAKKISLLSQLDALEYYAFGQLDWGAEKWSTHDWTAQNIQFSPIINEPYGNSNFDF
jgi:hypothetical protein